MPYVKQDRRLELDQVVEAMVKANIKADGDLNYVLYTFAKRFIPASYNNYKNYLGELNEAAMEIRRRLLSEYEEKKIRDNGDIL